MNRNASLLFRPPPPEACPGRLTHSQRMRSRLRSTSRGPACGATQQRLCILQALRNQSQVASSALRQQAGTPSLHPVGACEARGDGCRPHALFCAVCEPAAHRRAQRCSVVCAHVPEFSRSSRSVHVLSLYHVQSVTVCRMSCDVVYPFVAGRPKRLKNSIVEKR
jgi:hypothetical protein